MATVQILKDLGEHMGLKGTELRDFIKEQPGVEREERNQQREHDRIQQDKLGKFRLAQMEREKEKEQREREEQDKQRAEQDKQRESEKEQREREREKEQHEKEQNEKDREFEIERMKFERDKMDFELQMKATEVKKANSEKRG